MGYVRKALFPFILFLGMAGIGHAQVDLGELQRNLAPITFYNNEGPQSHVDTREQIRGIGAELGRLVRARRERAGAANRYFVIHSVTAQDGGRLDADIFGLGSNAGVDHIRNLRTILQGYLQEAYGYSAADAALLAEYITIYNAVYRGNWSYFSGRFKKAVIDNLNPNSAGLSLQYKEWPGGTLLLIPLLSSGLSSVHTSEISDDHVVERMQAEDDRSVPQRQSMADLKEREAEQAKREAESKKEAARNEESAVAKERQSLEERQRQLAEERRKLEEGKASGQITSGEAARQEALLSQRETDAAFKSDKLDQRESNLAAQKQEAARQEQFAEQKKDEARQDRESIVTGEIQNNKGTSAGGGAAIASGSPVPPPASTTPVSPPSVSSAPPPASTTPVTPPPVSPAPPPASTTPVTPPSVSPTPPASTPPVTPPSVSSTPPASSTPASPPSSSSTPPATSTTPVKPPSVSPVPPPASTTPVTPPSVSPAPPATSTTPVTPPSVSSAPPASTPPVSPPSSSSTPPASTPPVTPPSSSPAPQANTTPASPPSVSSTPQTSPTPASPPSGSPAPPANTTPVTPPSGSSTPQTSSTPESSSSESSSPLSSEPIGANLDFPIFAGVYLHGWHRNTVSMGLATQIGVGFDFGKVITIVALGEAAGGIGNRYILEGRLGGMGEVYFNKLFGVGLGGGFSVFKSNNPAETVQDTYMRLALMLILKKNYKTSLFIQRYAEDNWGLGVQFGWQF